MATGVTFEDIRQAIEELRSEQQSQSQLEASHVGNKQNQWQKPITEYGRNDPEWQVNLLASPFVGNIEVDDSDWKESMKTVDVVMKLLLIEIKSRAVKDFRGLRIGSYVRQGSSREGLKVLKADEFDTMLEFHFDKLNIQQTHIKNMDGYHIPGHCYLEINGLDLNDPRNEYEGLHAKNVFIESAGKMYLSSKNLHTKVFQSMVDKAIENINQQIYNHDIITGQKCEFVLKNDKPIKRKMNPPSINVTIKLKRGVIYERLGSVNADKELNLDFVPAFRLPRDKTTTYEDVLLDCPIHAICKWAEENSFKALEFVDQNLIWDVKSLGYERHILDVARRDKRKLYILTALRILKTYFVKTKEIASSPPQLVAVLKSYHLKQLAFYLLNFLCHKYPHFEVDGVQRALLYFICIMRTALNEKRLPHLFFSDNSVIETMLPGYPRLPAPKLRFDLFRTVRRNDSLSQALLSLDNHLIPNLGFSTGGGSGLHDYEMARVEQEFQHTVAGNDYF
ncbi:uncharacterized protein LOC128227688 [Mya arenaria]|uniref:uncharacterized protein LOC128227688 n=1 Tax=Mya arenaria TaxID=6604 RepID=UPI0022E24935|nr:uncharacterized protein LOC128227688 [Mya arenaria]